MHGEPAPDATGPEQNEAIGLYYDDFAPHYVPGWRSLEHYGPLVADFLLRTVTPECRVLDVGCGPGQLTRDLAPDVSVTGIDLSPRMLAVARAARPGGRYVRHDFHDPLPDDRGRFDVVVAVGCLEFCRDLTATLRNLADACAPGARLLVGVVEDRDAREPGRSRRAFSEDGLPGIDMHSYDATAQLGAVTAAGLSPWSYRFVPAWRHEEYSYVVRYGLWELRKDAPGT
ncbi:methyltransferase domain-containing protein [Paenibacillus sp. TRM 82003]|uniref:class I SAM-dependent methyltransferase n=1 Tax=Kineococcus sp. TRM81007 TaxID=2925831 RepID=UPI001F55C818|nr:class I SAM-dependent methyltransferase [Kineococcus sp. TRM81007]MCI2239050.1 methyltransferase domain-containing protein [Kineococcus sp. TRM81007]MCI3924470.1 methyltransferase domain-containing protein [Paenibacillus sp. TRM 82003]